MMPAISVLKHLPAPTLDSMLPIHADLIAQIERALPVSNELRHKLLYHDFAPIRLLARLVGPLPASEQSHDDDVYGLYRHSLEVVASSLTKFLARPGRPDPTNARAHRRWVRQLVTVYCSAVVHDLGKVLFMHVEIVGGTPGKPWVVMRGYLLDYLAEHAATGVAVGWHWGRMRNGFQGHEPLAGWLTHKVILLDLINEFGVEQANNFFAILTRSLEKPSDGLGDVIKDADLEVSMRSLRSEARQQQDGQQGFVPAPGQITPLIDLPDLGSSSRAHDFVWMFRSMAKAREIQVNGLHADCYVSPTHTILPIGSPPRAKRGRMAVSEIPLMRRIAERIRGLIISDQQASKSARDAYSVCEGHLFLPDFSALSSGAGAWCVLSSPTQLEGYSAIKHYLAIERARGIAYGETPCIIVRNEILWGLEDPTKIYNVFVDPLVLWDGASKTQPSVDPEVIGFRTVERPNAMLAGAITDPNEARSVIGLGFIHRVWQSLDGLAPYHQMPANIRTHWQELAVRLASPGALADESLLLSSLEAIAERLDDMNQGIVPAVTTATYRADGLQVSQVPSIINNEAEASPATTDLQTTVQPVAQVDAEAANHHKNEVAIPSVVHSPVLLDLNPLQRVDILYRRIAALAIGPLSPLPDSAGPHAAAHIIVDDEDRCFIAWPAVVMAIGADLGLTEIEASRHLEAVALRLDAERLSSEHPLLQSWEWSGLRLPPPRTHSFYLVVRRDTVSLVADIADGRGLPSIPSWSIPSGRMIVGELA